MQMEYEKVKTLDKGTYSNVFSAKRIRLQEHNLEEESKDTKLVVMKVFKTEKWNGISTDVIREIATLQSVQSPYIIPLLDIDYVNFTYIILPLYETNLLKYLKETRPSRECVSYIFQKICLGISALHSASIMHRDIKPSNICLSHNVSGSCELKVVLIDYGMARKEYGDESTNRSISKNGNKTPNICTIWYRAPEIACHYTKYSFPVDIWSAGCVLTEMYTGTALFKCNSEMELLDCQTRFVGLPKRLPFICPIIGKIEGKLHVESKDSTSDYPTGYFDLLKGMLHFNPLERFSITTCLNSSYFSSEEKQNTQEQYLKYLEEWKSELFYSSKYVNPEISFKYRKVIVSWMFDLCKYYEVSLSSYFIAVMILDFYSIRNSFVNLPIKKDDYQLLGMTALLIAVKLNSKQSLTSEDLLEFCVEDEKEVYTQEQLFNLEKSVLSMITLNFPNLYCYINSSKDSSRDSSKDSFKNSSKLSSYLIFLTMSPKYLLHRFFILTNVCIDFISDIEPNLNDEEISSCYLDVKECIAESLLSSSHKSLEYFLL
jgi:serine/threonine protein kinase